MLKDSGTVGYSYNDNKLNNKRMEKIIVFLDGNKQKISALCAAILGLLITSKAIDFTVAFTILSVINILFGTTAVITDSSVYNATPLGQAISNKRNLNK